MVPLPTEMPWNTSTYRNSFLCFHSFRNLYNHESYLEGLWSQCQWHGPHEEMNLCGFTQDTLPTPGTPKKPPVTSTILTTLWEVHSFTSDVSKVHQSNIHDLTTHKLSTATLQRKGPTLNKSISKLPRKLSPPTLMSLSLTPAAPKQPLQQKHMPSFIFPHHISEENCGATGHHPTKT